MNIDVPNSRSQYGLCDQRAAENDISNFSAIPVKPCTKPGSAHNRAEASQASGGSSHLEIPYWDSEETTCLPMKTAHAITEIMAMPYVDASWRHGSGPVSNVSLEDYARYCCCLREELSTHAFNGTRRNLEGLAHNALGGSPPKWRRDHRSHQFSLHRMLLSQHPAEDFKLFHRNGMYTRYRGKSTTALKTFVFPNASSKTN